MSHINPKLIPPRMLRCMSPEDRAPIGKAAMTDADALELQSAASEKELQQQIQQYLQMKGVRVVLSSRMDRRTTNKVGQPDAIFCFEGCPVALEVKMPGKAPTDEQRRVLSDMIADGWCVAVVRSLDDVIGVLRGLRKDAP